VIVYAVVDDSLSSDFPLGVELEVFVRREDAERFIEALASSLGIDERLLRPADVTNKRGEKACPRLIAGDD
jgi:hypothetical protein